MIFTLEWKGVAIAHETRMHSSRMRTACLLPVSPSMHSSQGDVPGPGVHLVPGGYLVWGVTWSWGVYLVPGGTYPGTPPLWTEWQTGVKILPCSKLRLRAVKMGAEHILKLFSSPRYKKIIIVHAITEMDPLNRISIEGDWQTSLFGISAEWFIEWIILFCVRWQQP